MILVFMSLVNTKCCQENTKVNAFTLSEMLMFEQKLSHVARFPGGYTKVAAGNS